MIFKTTFANDDEANAFFRAHEDNTGTSTIYIIKYIIINSFDHTQEQHLIYSTAKEMKSGMHLRRGGAG